MRNGCLWRICAAILLARMARGATRPVVAAGGSDTVPTSREQIRLSYAPLVKQAAPAVVNIYAKRRVRTRSRSLFDDPFFRRFFGDRSPFGGLTKRRERLENSLGSGVIVDPKGYIVTNHHVIQGAEQITAVLTDRREFSAELITSDEKTDLAVLRIDADGEPLPFLEMRDSDELQVGDLVLAIGNPFGIGQTVTSGIVSATARASRKVSDYGYFIQTDAAINPGNSGGALISMDGKLVGINSAIYSKSGGSLGIGFAIPTAMVRTVVAGAIAGGRVTRPWFGAKALSVTADIADSLGMDRPTGVILQSVYADGPAARAGLSVGDIVLAIDGREVNDPSSLRYRLATQTLGGEVSLKVWRTGENRQATLAVEPPPEKPARQLTELAGRHPLAGATVANLSPALAAEIDFDLNLRGVVVLGRNSGSPAARLRLSPGDIILQVNGRTIADVDGLVDVVAARGVARWQIEIRRGDRIFQVTVTG